MNLIEIKNILNFYTKKWKQWIKGGLPLEVASNMFFSVEKNVFCIVNYKVVGYYLYPEII